MLLIGILRPKLLNISFSSFYLINLDFLLPYVGHFDNIIILPLSIFGTVGFYIFCIFSAL